MVHQNIKEVARNLRKLHDIADALDDRALAADRHGRRGERILQFERPAQSGVEGAQLR